MLAKEDILRAEELGDDNAAAINVLRGGVLIPHKLAAALMGSCQITEPEMVSPVALGIETARLRQPGSGGTETTCRDKPTQPAICADTWAQTSQVP
jgi:hypothetical protein